MQISAIRDRLGSRLTEFLWDEWAQLGVSGSTENRSPWAQDPEALLLLTFEVARREPRLFDEVMDWMLKNEAVISRRRLQNLCEDDEDRQLAGAATAWVAAQRRRLAAPPTDPPSPTRLFREFNAPLRRVDQQFRAFGLLRPALAPTGNSRAPDTGAPIALALRLRLLLGVGARAESVRFLYTVDAPRATVAAVTAASGYAKRNVAEALASLFTAHAVEMVVVGGDQRYGIRHEQWAPLLGGDRRPLQVDWPQLSRALRVVSRWLERSELASMSEYLRESRIRDLREDLLPLLNHAGVLLPPWRGGADAVLDLADMVDALLFFAGTSEGGSGQARYAVTSDSSGQFRWRLLSGEGRILAESGVYKSRERAVGSAARLRQNPQGFTFRSIGSDHEGYRWQVRGPSGRPAAASTEAFADEQAAQRAGQQALQLFETAKPAA